jgi:tetratricopeptide (TPR) repeat protein
MAGSVHRVTLIVTMTLTGVGFALFLVGSRLAGRNIRISWASVLPSLFVLIPIVQSIPMPLVARNILDPKGTTLLTDLAILRPSAWPLSLDPSSTLVAVGKAAAGLGTFLIAYHLASGRRGRMFVIRAVALTGIVALAIGAGHKILGFTRVYGLLPSTPRTLLVGPFVNANHTAELLELATFVCLACSYQRRTALNRVGWLVGVALCAGGMLATLSRGAVVGATMGLLLFGLMRRLDREGRTADSTRGRSLAWAVGILSLVTVVAITFGASEIADRFKAANIGSDLRPQLWRDSLRVLAAHPMGIGRGAFDRVFPVYRTLKSELPIRFAFVENQPLQLLVDGGWFFFAAILLATALVVSTIVRNARRDAIEAALLAGLFAVLVHNLLDFGLETLGILLPFLAILGTTLGRIRVEGAPALSRRWPILALCGGGLVIGVASVAHASYDNFDDLLKRNAPPDQKKALLWRAQRVHPLDYYYPLMYARFEPLRAPTGTPSPRFRALNRALSLCPGCETVHEEVARDLWALGLRGQALLEWRSAIELQPRLLVPAMSELLAAGANAEELASLAASEPPRMVEVAAFLGSTSHVEAAFRVLSQAEALGLADSRLLLTRAKLELQAGKLDDAQRTLARVHSQGIRSASLAVLDAQLRAARGGDQNEKEALEILDRAAAQYPLDLPVQQMRLDLVTRFQKWQTVDRALDGYKQALFQSRGSATEAHLAAARIYSRLERWTSALEEYRIALSEEASNVSLWMEYGKAAEAAGRYPTAQEAYFEAERLSPADPGVVAAIKALDVRGKRSRAEDGSPVGSGNAP